MANRTVRVQPISGKFVSCTSNGKIIRIWLVDPKTNQQGTEVSYEDALTLLAMRHPVVCLSQEKDKKTGKYIEQFTEDDWKKVREMHDEALNQISGNTLQPSANTAPSGDTKALEDLVKTQAKLIEAQAKQLEMMSKNFEKMEKNVSKIMKKGKITGEE